MEHDAQHMFRTCVARGNDNNEVDWWEMVAQAPRWPELGCLRYGARQQPGSDRSRDQRSLSGSQKQSLQR